MNLPFPMLAIDRAGTAPQFRVQLGAADIGRKRPDPPCARANEGAAQILIAKALRHEQAHLFLWRDAVILDDRAQRRIAGQADIARADRGFHHAQIFIVDVPEYRAAAKGVAAPGRNTIDHKADLVEVEGAGLHAVAKFIQAQSAVGLDVETGQLLQHFQARNARRGRQQRFPRDRHDIADLIFANRFGRLRNAAASDGDVHFVVGGRFLREGHRRQCAGRAGEQQRANGQAGGE